MYAGGCPRGLPRGIERVTPVEGPGRVEFPGQPLGPSLDLVTRSMRLFSVGIYLFFVEVLIQMVLMV